MVGVMEEAEQQGEFHVADKNFTAEVIQSAKFRHPLLWSKPTLSRLEKELDGVFTLLVEGMRPPASASARVRNQEVA